MNILIQARQSKSWPLVEPYEEPERLKIKKIDGAPIGPNVPEYQILQEGTLAPADTIPSDCRILVADFCEAFFMHDANAAREEYELNTPLVVRPLDSLFVLPITSAADVWTLGMTDFDILGRRKLFDYCWADDDSIVLEAMLALGSLPPHLWQRWPNRSQFFNDGGSWTEDSEMNRPSECSIIPPIFPDQMLESMGQEEDSEIYRYNERELNSLEKMLQSMMQYEPKNCGTVDQVLRSEWVREYGIPALVEAVPDVDLSKLDLDASLPLPLISEPIDRLHWWFWA